MKKGLKVLSTSLLLTTLFMAGCSCNKDDKTNVTRPENASDKILDNLSDESSDYTLLDIYNALIASDADGKIAADKLLNYVANKVLKLDSSEGEANKSRYDALVKEKLEKLTEDTTYQINGEFSLSLLKSALKADGYNVSCDELTATCYEDYVNRNIRADVLTTLLKEQYIKDVTLKDKSSVLTSKKIRYVDYFTVSSEIESTYKELKVRDFMRDLRTRLANKEIIDFSSIEEELREEMKNSIDVEYAKIGTSKDYNQSIAASYTNNFTQDKEIGYESKIKGIEDSEFAYTKWIDADSSSSEVVNSSITSRLLSIDNPSEASNRVVYPITTTDEQGNEHTEYYLVSVNAGASIDADDILLSEANGSNYVYSVVRFRSINADATGNDREEAIRLLASTSTLANGALAYYVDLYKDDISVHDDTIYTYLKSLYPAVFIEERVNEEAE